MRHLALFSIILCSFTTLDCETVVKHSSTVELQLQNRLIKVAVVDTGLNLDDKWSDNPEVGLYQPKICPGSKDFTGEGLDDRHGHGTHIAGLITKYAGNANHCLIIYKYFTEKSTGLENLDHSIQAFQKAIHDGVDIINYSGGGILKSDQECRVLKTALDKGIKIVAAAGNEGINIDYFHFYPANCDDRIVIVENIDKNDVRASTSSYSKSTVKEHGVNVLSLLPNGQYGYMTGTSQATAIRTGKMVRAMALELVK